VSGSKRFYAHAAVGKGVGGYGLALDDRPLKTPAGAAFVAPTLMLAEAIAGEWNQQGERVVPATMPLTQLAFASVDRASRGQGEIAAFVAKFGETDLCCHRAAAPVQLVARQAAAWDPMVCWGAEALGVALPIVIGVTPSPVAQAQLDLLRRHAEALGDFRLTALGQTSGLAGSALIGFALVHGRVSADDAFEAAALDDLWSLEHWGEDAVERARLDAVRAEFQVLAQFILALKGVK
jgi:chaperone required for assembly of F1-ATPase